MKTRRKTSINYLSNAELLYEINKSKVSYSSFISPEYEDFCTIIQKEEDLTPEIIESAKTNKAILLNRQKLRKMIKEKWTKEQIAEEIDNNSYKPEDISMDQLVFRIMTYEHVPDEYNTGKKNMLNNLKFPPFKHYAYIDGKFTEVGRSHWEGGLHNGHFNVEHGKVSNNLSRALIKMVDRYGTKANFSGYCVDSTTEALTQRGWLSYDQIEVGKDKILSLDTNTGHLTWSNISDMYVGEYDGNMFQLNGSTIDALITPGHKFIDKNMNIKPIEDFMQKDHIVAMGEHVNDKILPTHSDSFVELVGWYVTDGSLHTYNRKIDGGISYYAEISQSRNANPEKCDRIEECIKNLIDLTEKYGYTNSEHSTRSGSWSFSVPHYISKKLVEVAPKKVLTNEFILSLTQDQRELLIKTMIDGDGSGTQYVQKDKAHVDAFLMLCTMAGITTHTSYVETERAFGPFNGYVVTMSKKKSSKVECIDLYGAKRKQTGGGGKWGKLEPTVPYRGIVWCPSTDYGNFVCRRGKKIYVTGNSYLDEMKGQALLQLSTVAIQFDESYVYLSEKAVSTTPNAFSWYTSVIHTSFLKILKAEKRQRDIRDEIMQSEIGISSDSYRNKDGE